MDYTEKIDYSSLSTYLDCPRKFLFQYMLHLRNPRPSIHLIFGSCWHYGLECAYKEILTGEKDLNTIIQLSITNFNNLWQIEGLPHWKDEDLIFPKSPGHAANMYHAYWHQFLTQDLRDKKVVAVESPFSIDLPNLPRYIGRLDLVLETSKSFLEIIDHKTAKALWPTTLTGFEMSFQTVGYLTAGFMFFKRIPKIIYNIALCQKSKIEFHRFDIHKTEKALEQFLDDLTFYISEILNNIKLYQKDILTFTDRKDNIKSFRRRPGYACTAYMSPCPYLDLCKVRNNPLLWREKAPSGYHYQEWDPDTHEAEIKAKLRSIE